MTKPKQYIDQSTLETLLDQQRKIFVDSMSAFVETTNKRIDSLAVQFSNDIASLKTSLEFSQKDIDGLKKADKLIHQIEKDLETLKTQTKESEKSLDYLDNQSRRNNLRIDGLPEIQNETWEKTEEVLKKTMMDTLGFTKDQVCSDLKIERAHRVKPNTRTNPDRHTERTVVVKFESFKGREALLRAAREKKPDGIFIREDFSNKVMERRRELLPEMYAARDDGKIAYLSFDKLIVRDRDRRDFNQASDRRR